MISTEESAGAPVGKGLGLCYLLERAGLPMPITVVVVRLQADMPAWAFGSGMRSWNHSVHPCTLCVIKQGRMCQVDSTAHEAEKYTHDDYLEDVSKCKIVESWAKHIRL